MTNEAQDHMSKAMMRVMRTSPYYTQILMRHEKVQDPSVNGAVINGSELRYNPEQIMDLPVSIVAENLKHMAMHIAYGHHLRAARMEQRYASKCEEGHVKFEQIFNESADLAINSLLRKAGEVDWRSDYMKDAPMPGNGDWHDLADGLAAEEYFEPVLELRYNEEPPPFGGGDGEGAGSGGGEGDGDGSGESDQQGQGSGGGGGGGGDSEEEHQNWGQVEKPSKSIDDAEQDHQEQIAAAKIAAQSAGEGTGSVQELILHHSAPVKVNWRQEMSSFLQMVVRGRPNFRKINRRMFGGKIIFPTNKDKSPKKCAMIVDVSGSMDDKCVAAVFDHIEEIIKAHANLEVVLAQFDYEVFKDSIETYTKQNVPISCDERGRVGYGGTRFMPAIKWAEEQPEAAGVIMLTDLCPMDTQEFIEYRPGVPMIVLSVFDYQFGGHSYYGKAEPKHMKVIEIDPE